MQREISIQICLNGYIVRVGCQQLIYSDLVELQKDLSDYLQDPKATEKRIIVEKGFNRKITLNCDSSLESPIATHGSY